MRSIMQQDRGVCYLCGQGPYLTENGIPDRLEEHHVFGGNPGRKLSTRYGLTVCLHGIKCHREGKDSVHKNRETREKLQREGQERFEEVHGTRKEFMDIFGRNYL